MTEPKPIELPSLQKERLQETDRLALELAKANRKTALARILRRACATCKVLRMAGDSNCSCEHARTSLIGHVARFRWRKPAGIDP